MSSSMFAVSTRGDSSTRLGQAGLLMSGINSRPVAEVALTAGAYVSGLDCSGARELGKVLDDTQRLRPDFLGADLFAGGVKDQVTAAKLMPAGYDPRAVGAFLSADWSPRARQAIERLAAEPDETRTWRLPNVGIQFNAFDRNPLKRWGGRPQGLGVRVDNGAYIRWKDRVRGRTSTVAARFTHRDYVAWIIENRAIITDGWIRWDEIDGSRQDRRRFVEEELAHGLTDGISVVYPWDIEEDPDFVRWMIGHSLTVADRDGNRKKLVALGGLLVMDPDPDTGRLRRRWTIEQRAEIVARFLLDYPACCVHALGNTHPRFMNRFLTADPANPEVPLLARLQVDSVQWLHWGLTFELVFLCGGLLRKFTGLPMLYTDGSPVVWRRRWEQDYPAYVVRGKKGEVKVRGPYAAGDRMPGWRRNLDGRLRFVSEDSVFHGLPSVSISAGYLQCYNGFLFQRGIDGHFAPYPEAVRAACESSSRLVTHQLRLL